MLVAGVGCGDALKDDAYRGEPIATVQIQTPKLLAKPAPGTKPWVFASFSVLLDSLEGEPGYSGSIPTPLGGSVVWESEPAALRKLPVFPIKQLDWRFSPIIEIAGEATSLSQKESATTKYQIVAVEHVLTYLPVPGTIAPFGPSGDSIVHPGGAVLYKRVCERDRMSLVPVPLNTMIPMVIGGSPWTGVGTDRSDNYSVEALALARCSLAIPADELGTKIADQATPALAWQSDGSGLLVLSPALENYNGSMALRPHVQNPSEQLLRFDLATRTMEVVSNGTFVGPIQVAPSGLVYLGYQTSPTSSEIAPTQMFEVQINQGTAGTLRGLSVPGNALLSPNGMLFGADTSPQTLSSIKEANPKKQTSLFGVTGTKLASALARPVAWLANSAEFIVADVKAGDTSALGALDTAGNVRQLGINLQRSTGLHQVGILTGNIAGPLLLTSNIDVGLWSMPLAGAEAASPILTGMQGRLLPKLASIAAGATAEKLLIWGRKCLGLRETHCLSELHLISGATMTDSIVARAKDPGPVALSPKGDQVAISTSSGLFLVTLP